MTGFKEGNLTQRRQMLSSVVSEAKSQVRDYMKAGGGGRENAMLSLVRTAEQRGNKEIRNEAKRLLKERRGIDASPQDMNYQEVTLYISYIDYLKDIYEEAASL
jgi:hypothetical protein